MNIRPPEFSVLIAAYNAERFILRTLESVRRQTYRHFELIVVDDGSTDCTKKVVETYSSQCMDLDLRFICQENRGMGGARNAGVKLARRPFIALLDHDDIWYPRKLERVAEVLRQAGNIDIVSHDEYLVEGSIGRSLRTIRARYRMPETSAYETLLFKGRSLSGSATVIKKERLLEVGLFSERKDWNGVEDFDMWLKLARAGCKFYFLDEVLGEYILHGNNLSRDLKFSDRLIDVLDTHFKQWPKQSMYYRYLIRKRKGDSIRGTGKGLMRMGDLAAARSYLTESFFMDPLSWKTLALMVISCSHKLNAFAGISSKGVSE